MIDWKKLYQLLDEVTPLNEDCGKLCGSVCCTEWDQGVGMYLYPGEEIMFSGQENWFEWEDHDTEDFEFCPSWSGKVKFMRCKGYCSREKRPLACRVFPLMPYLTVQGLLELRFDAELGKICPLTKSKIIDILNPTFVERVRQVYLELLNYNYIKDDIEWQSRLLDQKQ